MSRGDYRDDFKKPIEEDPQGRGRVVGKTAGRDGRLRRQRAPDPKQSRGAAREQRDYAEQVLRLHSNPGRAWKGSPAQRLRVSREAPQAVLKITSHSRGLKDVRNRLRYISRQGELPLETEDGCVLEGAEEVDELAAHWAADFSNRKGTVRKARDAMNLVVSLPAGTDREKALEAAREFFAEAFAGNHEYAFAAHDDTDHFHIHLVVKLRGRDGKQMRASRKDPDLWRQKFAAKAREKGLDLDASPRWARGKGRRSSTPVPIHELRRRGEIPQRDTAAAEEALHRARDADDRPSEHEAAMQAINHFERLEYARQAVQVTDQACRLRNDGERLKALRMASDLALWAEQMPQPLSRSETLMAAVKGRDQTQRPADDEVRALTKRAERALRDQVKTFSDARMKRQVIAARARLTKVLDADRGAARQQSRGVER